MNAIAHILTDAEALSVERFIRRCEREQYFDCDSGPIAICRDCTRVAVPNQFYCTEHLR